MRTWSRLTFADRALIVAVATVHVLLVLAPLDVLDPVSAHRVGGLLWSGHLPYRDFTFEYPPLALGAFLLPGLAPAAAAKSVLALQAVGLEVLVGWVVLRHHPGALRRGAVLSLFLFPFLSGGFDAFPMAAIAVSTALLVRDRSSGWWVAATGALVKLSPVAVWAWGRVRPRAGVAAAVVAAAGALSPLLIARSADTTFLGWSLHRGVEAESVPASIAWLDHLVTRRPIALVYRFRATELVGAGPVAAAVAVVAGLGLAVLVVRSRRISPWLASLASVLLFMCGFKVLSPQYLAWGAPLAAVIGGRWFKAYATAAALTVLTYVVANSRLTLLSLTAVRNGVLVALTVAALRSLAIKPT